MAKVTVQATEDLQKIELGAAARMRDELRALIQEHQEERKQQEKLTDLLKDFVSEYDRLTERLSTQLKAIAVIVQKLENL